MQIYQNNSLKAYYKCFYNNNFCKSDVYMNECYKALLKERRKSENHTPENTMKMAFLCTQLKNQNGFDFATSTSLLTTQHRYIAYFGLMLCESEIHVLLINNIIKDLKEPTCDYVLKYLCNFANRSPAFRDICIKNQKLVHHEKYVIIKNVLGVESKRFKVFEVNNTLLFIKIQIILDTWSSKDVNYEYLAEAKILERSEDLFVKSKEKYMKIKVLQLLQQVKKTYAIQLEQNFVQKILKTLIKCTKPSENSFNLTFRYELCSFLLACKVKHEVIDNFVINLINSQHIYVSISGIELVLQYKEYHSIAAIKLIQTNYNERKTLKIIKKLINTDNYKDIFAQLELNSRKKNNELSKRRLRIFCSACKCFDEDFLVNLLFNYPIAIEYVNKHLKLSEQAKNQLFIRIYASKNKEYYSILCSILPQLNVEKDKLQKIFDFFVSQYFVFCSDNSNLNLVDFMSFIVSLSVKIGYEIDNHFAIIKMITLSDLHNKECKYYKSQIMNYYQIFAKNRMIIDEIPILYSIDTVSNPIRKKVEIKIKSDKVKVVEDEDVYRILKISQFKGYTNILLELVDFENNAFIFRYIENNIQYSKEITCNE